MFMENSIFADMEEIWNKVRNYENYDVSNLGGARSNKCILKPLMNENGYYCVNLYKNGKRKRFYIHRLVWETFNGEIPDGMQVNHINEDKTDNRLENLNLMSLLDNVRYGTGIKRSAEKRKNNSKISDPVLQLTPDGRFVCEYPSMHECERKGFNHAHVCLCCQGKQKTHKGFIFRYKNAETTI